MKTADKLHTFRRQCERQAGKPLSQVEVPLLWVLHDVCEVLNIPQEQRLKVLGRRGMKCLRDYHRSPADTGQPSASIPHPNSRRRRPAR